LNELHLQWQMQDIARPQWIDIVGATQETFAPTDFYVGHVLRVVATFLDGKGVTEQVFSAPTAALVTNPNVNHAPTVVTQVAEPGLFDTSAEANQPIRLFLPLITTFTDDLTPASQLIYKATLADGRPLETVGLSFTVLTDATGVTGGLITGTPTANFTGPIDVLVSATDGGPGTPFTVTDTFTINVLPANNAPVITSDGGGDTAVVAVLENTTAVTTVTATDPDAGTTFAFSIAGGADASQFTINATTGELSFIHAPNFEAPTDAGSNNVYDVNVQVSDGSLVDTQALAVTVANQNEAPVITSGGGGITAAVSVVENTTAVTTVTATDQDVGTTLTYSIAGGADAGKFAIDATTGALSFKTAPVFGAPTDAGGNNVYDVIVRASDGSLNDTQAIAVTVTETNKAPTRIVLDPAIVVENQPGAIIGTLTVLDPNVGDAHSITLSDARFQVVGGQLKLVAGQSLNHETETSVTITVTATDQGGLSKTSDVTIYVGDVADTTPTITGTAAANTLTGTAGNDVIAGLGGNDSLSGGAGNDVLDGGAGADNMTGGTGNDIYIVDNATDTVVENANEGLDAVQTTLASYTLGANVENLIHTAATAFTGNGNALDNVIVGNTGNDTLNGNAGNDTLFGDAGNDTLNGGDGLDAIYGGVGNDTLNGDAGDDMLSGGDGNDVLIGGAGSDYLNGGAGIDTASYATSTTAVIANLAAPSKNTGDAAGDIYAGIENLIGGSGNDTLTGDANANSLDGGAGDDILIGGAAADALIGGAGIDTASYANAIAGVVANLAASAGNTGDAAGDTYTTIENLTGSALADTLTGSAGVNVLDGGAGNDILDGGAGNDTLIGGTGNDTLIGGAGADALAGGSGDDTYVVDNAGDVVTESLGAGTDLAQTTLASYTLGDNVENLTFTNAGAHVGTGNALDNIITGNAGVDTLSGLAGNDSLIGGAGNDTLDGGIGNDAMVGGLGNDTFVVDSVADVVIENVAEGTDTVQTTLNNYTLGANVENLTFTGAGDFSGTGNDLANTITGGAGNDALDGGFGIDRLVGGAGDDTYRVDNSGDVIVEAAGAGIDTVLATAGAYTLSANVDNLIFAGTGSFNGTGNALANAIVGGAGSDTLSGGAGDDTITGGAGNDTMNGGTGNDTFIFAPGFGNDTIAGFDADATGGQDLLAMDASLGINAANFNTQVVITDLGADTQVTIGASTITLLGVNGVGANSITIDDFRFL
jgi:Ca2+-binding RTX toxin-like protein